MVVGNVADWQAHQTGKKYPQTRYIKRSHVVLIPSNPQHNNLILKHLKVTNNTTSVYRPTLHAAQITPSVQMYSTIMIN